MGEQNETRANRFAYGTSEQSVQRALRDQGILERARRNAHDDETRYTRSTLTEAHYEALRSNRDDLDFRDWNASAGFSGIDRRPEGPGVHSQGQRRRAGRRQQLDEGF